jgi:hypothetical protein
MMLEVAMKYLIVLLCFSFMFAAVFGCTQGIQSMLLASVSHNASGGVSVIATGIEIGLAVFESMPDGRIFDEILLTPDDEGSEFTVYASDDASFQTITGLLTNGVDDRAGIFYDLEPVGEGGSANLESAFFEGGETGEYLPDFAGFQIDYFTLRIDTLTFDIPGSDPNEDGIWTDYSYTVQVKIYGHSE